MTHFDPYHQWLGIPPRDQPPNHYRLLGIELFEDDANVIQNAADRQTAHVRTFQMGKDSQVSQKILNEIARARVCLLQEDKKAAYDNDLEASLPAPPAISSGTAQDAATEAGDGTVFGEYELLDVVGKSSTGQLFKARHRSLGRVVALKVLSDEASKSPKIVARFRRKIRILAQLNHPNLVVAHDGGQREGTFYIVMEYVNGRNLAQHIKRQGVPTVEEAVDYIVQAAQGLRHAHEQNVLHRNIKPSNLMLDENGTVKVIGMGLALLTEENAEVRLTGANVALGSADFMAPEQATDSHTIDRRADIYSLGCTLYYLLTGEFMYAEKNALRKALAHRNDPIPVIRQRRPEVSAALDRAFAKMVAKQPSDRHATLDEVIDDLQGALSSPSRPVVTDRVEPPMGIANLPTVSSPRPIQPPPAVRKGRQLAIAIGISVGCVLLVLAILASL